MRVDLGGGGTPGVDGWTTVDLLEGADVVADLRSWWPPAPVEEARMIHVLEHFPRAETAAILARVRSYLVEGGLLTVEVPDMEGILARGTTSPTWEQDIYGAQNHEGEFHKAGFTQLTLEEAIRAAGFGLVAVGTFVSILPMRPGMPCVAAAASAD